MTPQLLSLLAAVAGIGVAMTVAGVQKNVYEWRRQQRTCPSCGRRIEARVCGRCLKA